MFALGMRHACFPVYRLIEFPGFRGCTGNRARPVSLTIEAVLNTTMRQITQVTLRLAFMTVHASFMIRCDVIRSQKITRQ